MITLVDAMNLFMIEMSIAKRLLMEEGKELDENNLPFFYSLFVSKINTIFSTYRNVVFCWEGKDSLARRREIFPGYKRNRDALKSEDSYKLLSTAIPVIQSLLEFYPCKQIRVEGAEGDDVIYALSKKYKDDVVYILSTDGDLTQIINHFGNNIKIYNIIKKSFVEPKPNIILEKAIVGDNSDGIPGLQRVGKKTFEKMMLDKNYFNEVLSKGNNKEVFKTILQLVDLSLIPKELEDKILLTENTEQFRMFKPDDLEAFFFNNKMKKAMERWSNEKEEIIRIQGV